MRKEGAGNDSGRPWWGCADLDFVCWESEQMGDRQTAWKGLNGPVLSFESFAVSK